METEDPTTGAAQEVVTRTEQETVSAREALEEVHHEIKELHKLSSTPATPASGCTEANLIKMRSSVKTLLAHMLEETARAARAEEEVRSLRNEVIELMTKHLAPGSP